jgi:ABC-2 type transport system permease protein
MQSVVEEKESKTIEIILTSVKPVPLLVGKTLALGLLGLFQMGLWSATLFVLADQASVQIVDFESLDVSPTVIIIALAYFALGYGFLSGIFASMGAIANTTREGSSLAGWATFPTIVPLFFITAIVNDPNGTLAVLLSIFPFTAPITMVMRSVVTTIPLIQIIPSLVLMVLLVMLSIWLAGRLFRVGSLLRGTTPKLRELPRLILRG